MLEKRWGKKTGGDAAQTEASSTVKSEYRTLKHKVSLERRRKGENRGINEALYVI